MAGTRDVRACGQTLRCRENQKKVENVAVYFWATVFQDEIVS
jgi:hypothetical protein